MTIRNLGVLDSLVEEDFVEMNVTICDREVTSGILTLPVAGELDYEVIGKFGSIVLTSFSREDMGAGLVRVSAIISSVLMRMNLMF